jgi:6-phosphogluconolactonase/glucosamine-6-phosphate isomerase/deaminase
MKVQRFQTPEAISDGLFNIFKDLSSKKPEGFHFFAPTGKTPLPFYRRLTGSGETWVKKLKPIQVDEIRDRRRLYFEDLKTNLLRPGRMEVPANIIDPTWTDRQFSHHVEKMLSNEISVAILGLGMNGHVGLHEPGDLGVSFLGGRVTMSETTLKKLPMLSNNEAFTFGAGAFLKAKQIFLVVTGDEKKEILKEVVERPATTLLPATLLKSHAQFQILTDIQL